jgi:hypothetical protein
MQVKEIELNKAGKLMARKYYNLNSDKRVIESENNNAFPNGFSDDVCFEESELIEGEYVVERNSLSYERYDPYNQFAKIYNKTYFNRQKQKIRVEEYGHYESFVRTFTYDDDGFLIEENIDDFTSLFKFKKKIYIYEKQYNEKLKKMIKILKYSKYDNGAEESFSYSPSGDLVVFSRIDKLNMDGKINEIKILYNYNDDGNWISKKRYENGGLISTHTREFGDFIDDPFDSVILPF